VIWPRVRVCRRQSLHNYKALNRPPPETTIRWLVGRRLTDGDRGCRSGTARTLCNTVKAVKIPQVLLKPIRGRVLDHMRHYPPTRVIENLAGVPYLNRWELRGNHPTFDIYLHEFLRSDDSRALHDHPGVSMAIVLSGTYIEWFRSNKYTIRSEGDFILRRATTPHRIEIDQSAPGPITVFLRGPKLRDWGFHCADGWRHHRDFRTRGCEF
jgi:hypothetical protein